jgi:hypothetical protein
VRFINGNKYKVGADSFYLECRLNGEGRIRVLEHEYVMQVPSYSPAYPFNTGPLVYGTTVSPAWHTSNVSPVIYGSTVSPAWHTSNLSPVVYSATATPNTNIVYSPLVANGGIYNANWSNAVAQQTSSVKLYKCRFECEISARVDSGQLKALQTDRLALTETKLDPISSP